MRRAWAAATRGRDSLRDALGTAQRLQQYGSPALPAAVVRHGLQLNARAADGGARRVLRFPSLPTARGPPPLWHGGPGAASGSCSALSPRRSGAGKPPAEAETSPHGSGVRRPGSPRSRPRAALGAARPPLCSTPLCRLQPGAGRSGAPLPARGGWIKVRCLICFVTAAGTGEAAGCAHSFLFCI